MSEKVYRWLLRLYPPHFREAYGAAALQLFRDRARHERGFFGALRLWFDLAADFAISLPREYRRSRPPLANVVPQPHADGAPSFCVLESGPPRPGALLLGAVLSITALAAAVPLSRMAGRQVFQIRKGPPGEDRPGAGETRRAGPQPGATQPQPASRAGAQTAQAEGFYAAERERVLREVIETLQEHYVDPPMAEKMADALLAREKAGAYDAITEPAAFAAALTREMREVSHDAHLETMYSETPLPDRPASPAPEAAARYQQAMRQTNCTFQPVKILPHNVGYLKFNSFPDPSVCREAATAAMAGLNRADAVIFDLRENRGGYPAMVMLLAAYLFDHPEYMYNPREDTAVQSWTRSPVAGSLLADKPVYILTSSRTFSGAEHFSYDLKMLKRAMLVGETTGGATDVGAFHRMDEHFGMGLREAKAINPYAEPDWAGKGVEPDVKVKAADALATAERLAQEKLQKKRW